MCPRLSFSTGRPATTGFGTIPAARTMVSASIVSSGKWTLPGSMARTPAWVRMSAPRRPPSTRGPVIRQLRVDLRHDAVAPLEQDEADLVAAHVLVKRRDPVHERGQLAEQLHPDQPAADDHEREQSAFALGVRLHVGPLEPLDDVVAEQEGVGQGLEREGVLRAGDHLPVGHGPESQDQMVVGQFAALARRRPGGPPGAPGRCPEPWLRRTGWSARTRGWAKSNVASPGCPEQTSNSSGVMSEEVVPAHENDLDIRPALAELLQVAGGVDPTEAAAEDHDPSCRSGRISTGRCASRLTRSV